MTTRERRPGEGSGAPNQLCENEVRSSITRRADVDAILPQYRSPAWHELGDKDPRKHAAIWVAADRWASIAASPYATELVREVYDWTRRRFYSDWSTVVSALAAGRMPGPSYAELERRRAVVGDAPRKPGEPTVHGSFVERHGGPYLGGAVDFWTGKPTVVQKPTVAKAGATW
jgi:hypothetical protein